MKIDSLFDYVIVDCPPSLGVLTVNAIYASDMLLIPTSYSKFSLDGVNDLFSVIHVVKENNEFVYRMLRNDFDIRNKQTNRVIDEKLLPFKENITETIIRKCESINQAFLNEENIFTFEPGSYGGEDYLALSKEIISYG